MKGYLDLLPREVLDIIEVMVYEMYKLEHKICQSNINKEINMLWLYVLWNAGFNNNNLINNIYLDNFRFNYNNRNFEHLVHIVKYSDKLNYIRPSLLKHIKYKY